MRPAKSTAIGIVALGASLLLTAGSVLSVSAAGSRFDESRDGRAIDAVAVVELRLAVESAYLSEVVYRMLDLVDPEVAEGWERPSTTSLDTTRQQLEEISERGGPSGLQARQVLDFMHDDFRGVDTGQLYDDSSGVRYAGVPDAAPIADVDEEVDATPPVDGPPLAASTAQRIAAIHELGLATVVPLLVLVESSAAELDARASAPTGDEFVEWLREATQTDGGWLGAPGEQPLRDSMWLDVSLATAVVPDAVDEIEAAIAVSAVADVDALVAAGVSHSRSARELGADAVAARVLQREVGDIIATLLDAEAVAVDDDASADRAAALMLRLLGATTGLAALALLVLGVRSIVRAGQVDRGAVDLAFEDPLTGLGNRRELETQTRAHLADDQFGHHVVAMIDLDRFKLVNDLHGHAAGDHVLRETAGRLRRFASAAASSVAGTEQSVIRLGGDEFLVTLHAPSTLDVDRFRAQLDLAREVGIPLGDDVATGGFSVGVAEAHGPADLDGMLAAADLSVYEDKAARSNGRTAAQHDAGAARETANATQLA